MKKLLPIILAACVLVGCSKKDVDPFKDYRNKTSSALFNDGEKALAKHDYINAAKNLEALDAVYPFGPQARQAQLDIIYAYYKGDNDDAAITAAERYIRLYPRGKDVDYAYYMKGIIGFTQGLSWLQKLVGVDPASADITNLKEAFIAFATLVQTFPHSIYTPDALKRMAFIRNSIANRQVSIADFYFQRQAYVAAANRAVNVVLHFQGAPSVVPALAIMVKCYRKLHLDKMAESTYRLLKNSYPQSQELKDLSKQ